MAFFKQFITLVTTRKHFRAYLDFASSTPVDKNMLKSFPVLAPAVVGANPSALHKEGVLAKQSLSQARILVAKTLDAHEDEVIFTSTATESDNLAIIGSTKHFIAQGVLPAEIVVYRSDIEHAAVVESGNILTHSGVLVKILPTTNGVIVPKDILVPLDTKVIIVSVMYVNNEIGTVQPIKDIAKRIRFLRKHNPQIQIIFHCDATQAPLHYTLTVPQLGVDMMTLGATKLYCPKGVGVLYVRRGIKIQPLLVGGGQEFGLRPGTEAVQLIHDFSYAFSFAQKNIESYTEKIEKLQQYFEEKISVLPEVIVTFLEYIRTPHITHIAVKDFDSELLVLELDARGIAVSAKSACKNDLPPRQRGETGPDSESEIVTKLYGKDYGAVRFSFGRTTTKKELDRAIEALKKIFEKYNK